MVVLWNTIRGLGPQNTPINRDRKWTAHRITVEFVGNAGPRYCSLNRGTVAKGNSAVLVYIIQGIITSSRNEAGKCVGRFFDRSSINMVNVFAKRLSRKERKSCLVLHDIDETVHISFNRYQNDGCHCTRRRELCS